MENKTKKRGRAVAKATKETKPVQPSELEQDAEPIVAEPLKAKGKRHPGPAASLEKVEKKTVAEKSKQNEPMSEVEDEAAEPDVLPEVVAPVAKRVRRKGFAEQPPDDSNTETRVKRKAVLKASESKAKKAELPVKDAPKTNKRGIAKPIYNEEDSDESENLPKPTKERAKANSEISSDVKPSGTKKNGLQAAEDAPKTRKRSRAKPGYKEDESDESENASKLTKGRAKAKAKGKDGSTDSIAAGKTAAKQTKQSILAPFDSTAAAKPAARGRRKALIPEETADVQAEVQEGYQNAEETVDSFPANGVTQRKRGKGYGTVDPKATAKGKKAKVTAPKMNKCATDYSNIKFVPEAEDKPWNFKISSWNVAGLRSWVGKGGLEFIQHERPDILCLQETKCTEDQLPDEARHIPGYHPYWLCKPGGYAGVAIYSKKMPFHVTYGLGDEEQDHDGRMLTAEYEKFYLVCVYVPNAGNKLITLPKRMRWDERLHQYLQNLNSKKPVILCGDMNVAHEEIDLANPKTNRKNAGFTQEERDGMTKLLSFGFVDTFRHLYPDRKSAYTFWTYMGGARAKNIGWRLDYFILSQRLVDKVTDNVIRPQVYGSDHCPVTLFLNI